MTILDDRHLARHESISLFVEFLRVRDHRRGVADRLGSAVAEDLFRCCVPALHDSVLVERDDRHWAGIDQHPLEPNCTLYRLDGGSDAERSQAHGQDRQLECHQVE
ncbi:unannotated protein [freshwater metagenome]|uniref:Unannotated protein n=1 Tax=freshwater metagenome TaxID=449393 RepID=A0A6J6ZDS4_9ZZZZ